MADRIDPLTVVADALTEIRRYLPVEAQRAHEGWDIAPLTDDAGMRADQAIAVAAVEDAKCGADCGKFSHGMSGEDGRGCTYCEAIATWRAIAHPTATPAPEGGER